MCARSCAWNVGHSTRQKLERSERAIAAVDCHSSPAGAGREIGRVASFRAAALAMPARKSASLLAHIRCRAAYHRRGRKPPVLPPREQPPQEDSPARAPTKKRGPPPQKTENPTPRKQAAHLFRRTSQMPTPVFAGAEEIYTPEM